LFGHSPLRGPDVTPGLRLEWNLRAVPSEGDPPKSSLSAESHTLDAVGIDSTDVTVEWRMTAEPLPNAVRGAAC